MDVFVHIPKTSGSTIRAILSRQYGIDKILYFEPYTPSWKQKNLTAANLNEAGYLNNQLSTRDIRLITGHYHFGVHSIIKKPCRYFSMVRDPIERGLSEYFSAFNNPDHMFRQDLLSGALSPAEFLSQIGKGQQYTSMLSGMAASRSSTKNVDSAIENIRTSFMVVGAAERFEESLLLIAKALGWQPPLFTSKNVTRLDDGARALQAAVNDAREQYKEFFRDDYAIYDVASVLLTEHIKRESTAFSSALDAFREIQSEIAAQESDEKFSGYGFEEADRLPNYAMKFIGSEPYRKIEDYLCGPSSFTTMGKNYVGHVDIVEGRTITGWAIDLLQQEPIEVSIWRSSECVATVRCDLDRPDLQRAGFSSWRSGFRVDFPEPIQDKANLVVCFERTMLRVPYAS